MNKHIHADTRSAPHAARPKHVHHPVGLLYTILRHGRGLSHEEAHRISLDASGLPRKAA